MTLTHSHQTSFFLTKRMLTNNGFRFEVHVSELAYFLTGKLASEGEVLSPLFRGFFNYLQFK